MCRWIRMLAAMWLAAAVVCQAVPTSADEKKTVLLLGQKPDNHPRSTHEYLAGARIVAKCLKDVPQLEIKVISADGDWPDGPDLLKEADGVFLFVSEGAKWIHAEPRRLEAFAQLAARGGGLVVLHWGMGTREARYIDGFLELFGACHGGDDRRYKIVKSKLEVAAKDHPIVRGVADIDLREEFYFKLKTVDAAPKIVPILKTAIEENAEMVAWAWDRPDGGRSFGFSGGHFHENWRRIEYRRLMSQAVLWSLKLPVPEQGLPVEITDADLKYE